ncbi:MAG TPA: CDP-alcohol phosphatidyltransferase family protein [Candidatus Deferrimicrobiaceae bacterium]|nr:CDP-alcohol phosphatidyltransferase family protein [Candidatus Deferrimicrobiaceae bacterium]
MAALPLFIYFFSYGNIAVAMLFFTVAAVTDLFDGYFARKLGAASKFGAYFDAAVDFILVSGIFASFTINSYYPAWVLVLIAASFTQFLVSSLYTKKLYDPLGKYIGSILYIAIALTLLSPATLTFTFVQIGFSLFAITSFATRTISFATYRKTHLT